MAQSKFSDQTLSDLKGYLNEVKKMSESNPKVSSYIADNEKAIANYKASETVGVSNANDMVSVRDEMKGPRYKEVASKIAPLCKTNCRNCMFHTDNCFINVNFIVFKSVELDKKVEMSSVRPSMRMNF